MSELVAVESVDEVAVVRMQRPPANAMEPGLLAAGADVVARLRSERPAAVVITGSGDFFSGGVDLKLAPTLSAGRAARDGRTGSTGSSTSGTASRGPVVAAVNGHAVAGGMILALCADHRVGSRSGRYGLTEVRVGAPYPVAALAVVRAELAPGPARRLVLGGELVDAEAALELGLLDELADADAVLDRAIAVARELAALPAATYETVKGQLRGADARGDRAGIERDPLARGWLGDEAADAARAVLDG